MKKLHLIRTFILSAIGLLCFNSNVVFGQNVPELMYYKFDAAGTTASNSASAPVGTNPSPILGTTLTIGTPAQFGTALVGTGGSSSTNYVDNGWATNLVSTPWTISVWLNNIPSGSTLYYLFGDAGNSMRAFVNGAPGSGNLRLTGTGLPLVDVTGVGGTAVVLHFVRTTTPNEIKVYKNGVFVSTHPITGTPTVGSGFKIGGYSSSNGLNGQLDEFRLYNRALDATEVAATWNAQLPLSACTAPPTPGTTTSSATSGICIGTTVSIGLSGNSFGTGQTYQLQSSSTQAGTYTDVGTSQSVGSFSVSPTVSTWYRVAVTCSGNTQYSVPVQVVVNPPFPAGTYTINSALPTGGTNFQSFTDAVNAIICGIAGPVVFNVSGGPYSEQITIPAVGGTSAVNTITFNGNGATLQFNSTSGARHILKLDGTDYVRINNLNIKALNTTYGWGIQLANGADHNIISHTSIDISAVTSTTIDNSGGIVGSNSSTDVNGDGNASNNLIFQDTIIGGYQGIIINGSATAQNAFYNVIDSNVIRDFYSIGIELTDNDSSMISYNNISRANRATVGTFEGIELGIGNRDLLVIGNRIHDTHNSATSQTGAAYGIFSSGNDAPVGSPNRIINNLIYNFNSGSGTQYGLYNSSSNGVYYYHNTVVLDNAASTSGTTKGFYQITTASDIQFINNIVFITRGGTGTKELIDLSTTTSSVISNFNVLYINSPAGTNYTGSFGTTGYATLANWQTANSGAYDQNSISVNPNFASVATGNFYPNNAALNTAGTNVGVAIDILGVTRDPLTPTPGAYQVLLSASADMGVKALLLPQQQNCYSNAETVTVTIRNYSTTTHNFATTPVTVNVSVTGPNATTFTPIVINTGTLASLDTMNVVISTNYSMAVPGTYVFNGSTSITTDANPVNNAMPATTIIVDTLDAGVASSLPQNFCVTGGIPTLSLAGNSGTSSLQWQESTSASGPWTNVGTNSTSYTPASANTTTMYYRAIATCGPNSDTSNLVTVLLSNPQLLSTTPAAICGAGSLTLQASASPGSTINWYTAATGGAPIDTGAVFVTPVLNNTTTYYVAASEGGNTFNTARLAPQVGAATTLTTYGLDFTVTESITLNSVNVISGTGTSITVSLYGMGGTPQLQTTGAVSVPAGQQSTIPLFWSLAPGTYRIIANGMTGSFIRENSTVTYPIALGSVGQINGFVSSIGGSVSTTASYYWFYNWSVSVKCETPRQAVTATVSPNTAITSQPVTQSVCSATDVEFSVDAVGANLTYQWMLNGQPIPGATADSILLTNVDPSDNGAYSVQINGLCGNVTSNAANLIVAPGNSWTGLTNTDWHTASNWCGGVPTSTSDVYIPTGTPYSPIITGTANSGNLTIDSLAVLTLTSGSRLNIHGNYVINKGTFNASGGTVAFQGSANQNIDELTAGNIIMNGAGITLTGNMIAENTLTLTSGNITIGVYDITMTGSVAGTTSSHIVTNSTGNAHSYNIGTGPVNIPIGPDAATYNPVTISNGQGRNYSARVAIGLNPSITDNSKAINRTWTVRPNTFVNSNVTIGLQYADAHANTGANPAGIMQVGVHNGTVWHNFSGAGITPTGTATARVVSFQTVSFGPTILANPGGITFQTAIPGIDQDVTGVMLLPNLVHSNTVLRVSSRRMMKINWVITDAQGRVVHEFSQQATAGSNDIPLSLGKLASGTYYILGITNQGKTQAVRFIKQ